MDICLLCKENEANKTGSHIIPSFLMKRINGDGKRDHEVGFVIGVSEVTPYFGRDIYEAKRKDITDNEELLENRENLDIKDYIFCKFCEDFFASLESKYARSMNLQFNPTTTTINKKLSPSDAMLFWCSIVWRVSITKHLGIRINLDLEERLRVALNNNCIDNLNVHYALYRCKDYSKESSNGTFAYMDINDKNILIVIDEFILILCFDLGNDKQTINLFSHKFQLSKKVLNNGIKDEEITPITIEEFNKINEQALQLCNENMQLPNKFRELYKKIYHEDIPNKMLIEVVDMVHRTGKLGDKYTIPHYAWCFKEILKKYGLIVENEDNTFTIVREDSSPTGES